MTDSAVPVDVQQAAEHFAAHATERAFGRLPSRASSEEEWETPPTGVRSIDEASNCDSSASTTDGASESSFNWTSASLEAAGACTSRTMSPLRVEPARTTFASRFY